MRKKLNFAILFYVLLIALGVSGCAHGAGQFENAPVNKIEGEHKMQTLKKAVGRGSVKVEFSL